MFKWYEENKSSTATMSAWYAHFCNIRRKGYTVDVHLSVVRLVGDHTCIFANTHILPDACWYGYWTSRNLSYWTWVELNEN